MNIPTLKFTAENLHRHFVMSDKCIYTIRDEPKGEIGQLFRVEDTGYFVLVKDPEPVGGGFDEFMKMCDYHAYDCGFDSPDEMAVEIVRIYGSLTTDYYLHTLVRVKDLEELGL